MSSCLCCLHTLLWPFFGNCMEKTTACAEIFQHFRLCTHGSSDYSGGAGLKMTDLNLRSSSYITCCYLELNKNCHCCNHHLQRHCITDKVRYTLPHLHVKDHTPQRLGLVLKYYYKTRYQQLHGGLLLLHHGFSHCMGM